MREGQRAGVEVPFRHSDGVPEAEQLCNEARSVGNTAWGTAGLNSRMQALEKAEVPWRHHLMVGSHDRACIQGRGSLQGCGSFL